MLDLVKQSACNQKLPKRQNCINKSFIYETLQSLTKVVKKCTDITIPWPICCKVNKLEFLDLLVKCTVD